MDDVVSYQRLVVQSIVSLTKVVKRSTRTVNAHTRGISEIRGNVP